MSLEKSRIAVSVSCIWLVLLAAEIRAEDWVQQDFKVAAVKKGLISIEYPEYWGKPQYEGFENITEIKFGPFGPKSKPLFMVHLQSVPVLEEISAEQLTAMAEAEVDAFSTTAFETDIPISELAGPHNSIQYFSITDKTKKWGEFDYMTMAVIATGNLLSKVYFFSSDGAPDFGSDALRFMESIQFTPPPAAKEEGAE
jgi:hypothetical protein